MHIEGSVLTNPVKFNESSLSKLFRFCRLCCKRQTLQFSPNIIRFTNCKYTFVIAKMLLFCDVAKKYTVSNFQIHTYLPILLLILVLKTSITVIGFVSTSCIVGVVFLIFGCKICSMAFFLRV